MERLNTYSKENETIHINDIYMMNSTKIIVKDIFTLKENTFVSYDNGITLITELIDKFISKDKEYLENIITNTEGCSCGCNR